MNVTLLAPESTESALDFTNRLRREARAEATDWREKAGQKSEMIAAMAYLISDLQERLCRFTPVDLQTPEQVIQSVKQVLGHA